MIFEIPEIAEMQKSIEEIKSLLNKPVFDKEWYTAEECWKLKGGCALSTFKGNRKYQCKGGIPDAYVGGRKVWNRNSVLEWLPVTDDQISEYLERIGNGKRI